MSAAWACAALAAAPPALAQAPEEPPEKPPEKPPEEAPQTPPPEPTQTPEPQQAPQPQPLAQEPPLEQQEPDTIMVERDPPEPEPEPKPEPEPEPIADPMVDMRPQTCDPYVVSHKAQHIGLGVEIGTGYQQNADPVEPLSLALGVTAERMLRERLAFGVRMSYITAGDQSRDQDGDGRDDRDTGNTHQVSFTAGPRLRRWDGLNREGPHAWELGLAAGYIQALSGVGASGPVAEIELRHTWFSIVSLGLRGVQGFAGAEPYRAVLASAWLGLLSMPERSWGAGCDFVERPRGGDGPGYGLGVHLPLIGYGPSSLGDLGVMPPGLGLSLAIQMRYPVDLVLRADFLWFLRQERDRLAMHTGLAGLRVAPARSSALSFTALAGYGVAYRPTPSDVDSGPVVDVGVSWDFAREHEGGLYIGAHGRFGLSSDNRDLGVVFLSVGLEARNDAYTW